MTAVFISSDNEFEDAVSVFQLLSCAAKVSAVFKGFTFINDDADFILLPLDGGKIEINTSCAAIIFDDSAATERLPHGCTVLCFCDKAAFRCSGHGRQVISCGMHNKDTITLSSTEKGKPVLSVQRRLVTFGGKTVEVGDFPLVTDEQNHRALMAAAVLMLLNGRELEQDTFSN